MVWLKETEKTMPKIKYRFSLTQEERDELEAIAGKGKHNSQKVINALILLNYDGTLPSRER